MTSTNSPLTTKIFNTVVIVAALGYFVDIYDLILFSIVRVKSLKEIGIADANLKDSGIFLIQMQMIGMLLGGIVWGILGDKKGRLSVLFFTILLYSLANLANGFVQTYQQYAILRVIAGFGLAGELGIGITLVSEIMTKESRGWGTSLVSGIGIIGAALAYAFAEWGWRQAYWAGGVLGLLLLFLRIYVHESPFFARTKSEGVPRGAFLTFFTSRERFLKYLYCILIGVPVWYTIGILITFSKEFAEALGINGQINTGRGVMIHYMGAAIGSILTGWISQMKQSRKRALFFSLTLLTLVTIAFFQSHGLDLFFFYILIFLLGVAQGYWAIFVTVAAEQFGTNLRSTATTTIPNFVRGAVVPLTSLWAYWGHSLGILQSAIIIAAITLILAFFALYHMRETFGKELDYHD